MDHRNKVKICKVVAHAILSDGQITDEESAFMKNLMSRYELSKSEQQEVMARNIDDDTASLVEGIRGYESRNSLMVEVVMAVAADNELSETERCLLGEVAKALEVDPAEMDMLVKNALM